MSISEKIPLSGAQEEKGDKELELAEEVTFVRGKETVVTKNIEEIKGMLEQGFRLSLLRQVRFLIDAGINVRELVERGRIKTAEKLFQKNEDRDLLYLKNGIERWKEAADNFRYNRFKYERKVTADFKDGSLEKKIFNIIQKTDDRLCHDKAKDMAAQYNSLLQGIEVIRKTGFPVERLEEICRDYRINVIDLNWDSSIPNGEDRREEVKDKKIKEVHPLLAPFMEEIGRLKEDGLTELPDWLAEQAEMAVMSAYYINLLEPYERIAHELEEEKKQYDKFIQERNIKDAPDFPLIDQTRVRCLEIMGKKVNRIKK